MSGENSFTVKYFLKDQIVLDVIIPNWQEYAAALKLSSTVTIKETKYKIKEINLVHEHTVKGLSNEIHVSLSTLNNGKLVVRPSISR